MTTMSHPHTPADVQELIEIVRSASAAHTQLQVMGGGSKRGIGFPNRQTSLISMTKFDRIIDYDPHELVITVGAGARLAAVQALLAKHEQMLAFEPCDFAAAIGEPHGATTIGGVVGAGFAGSRRVSAGNVRDHMLGFTAVSGRGDEFVAGGRVVKNVTGYDLPKLMCGSWGQLAILTQLTLKVLPRPRVTITLDALDLGEDDAFAAMIRAARSQCEVAAAAHLPRGMLDEHSHTLVRLEGFGPSVEARAAALAELLREARLARVNADDSAAAWSAIPAGLMRDSARADEVLWRIVIPSTAGARLCASLRELESRYCADWAGGLVWARTPAALTADKLRSLAEECGGHATMLSAPHAYRASAPALHPEPPAIAALTRRVKIAFDPAGILDPQRFATGEA
jgi:glycolate oxidase FAD binding subunit